MDNVRIDKWLWAVRLFKTRSNATDACRKGRVTVKGVNAKPSRLLAVGDVVQVKKQPITLSFKVLGVIQQRVGPKLVELYAANVTPPDQYELLEKSKSTGFIDRPHGLGRPTKKDRRELDQFTDTDEIGLDFDLDDDEWP
jgi:ribosome-associated heat shock protein Hsp15